MPYTCAVDNTEDRKQYPDRVFGISGTTPYGTRNSVYIGSVARMGGVLMQEITVDSTQLTSAITPLLITGRITAYFWSVQQGDTLVSSGSTNDLLEAQGEMDFVMSTSHLRGFEHPTNVIQIQLQTTPDFASGS